ncbi:hypothetical protein OIU78_017151 [Salix suchowensis]|nr:hypothetical protein OIU78_017151 [Salix suchowensis]
MESSSMNNIAEKDVDLLVDTAEAEVASIGGVDESPRVRPKLPSQFPNPSSLNQPELDSFMEAYCFALSKLKEAMEEPQQETAAFISSMHLQLKELTRTHSKSASEPPTSTASSGELLYFIPLLSLLCCQAMNDNSWVICTKMFQK